MIFQLHGTAVPGFQLSVRIPTALARLQEPEAPFACLPFSRRINLIPPRDKSYPAVGEFWFCRMIKFTPPPDKFYPADK